MKSNYLRFVVVACVSLIVSACGGSGTDSGGSLASNAPAPISAVTGTITGFGSVHVNGIHFDTSGAAIAKNGAPALQSDLRVGQLVKVRGSVNQTTGEGVASSVSQDDNVEGPIASIDAAAGKFVVLGQTIILDTSTSFDNRISPASIQGLKVNDQVEVSGMVAANGDIKATRVELRRAGQTQLEVTGTVSSADTAAKKFKIAALIVNYSTAQLEGFANGQPGNGDLVEAKGTVINAAGELVATKVENESNESRDADRGDRREVEGLVTRYVSATDFDVAGRRVTTNSATRYEGGVVGDLVLNARVEVEGSLDAAGILVAAKVEFRNGGNARIEAKVDSIDSVANKITVLGVVVTVNNATRIEDKTAARIEAFSIRNLATGDYVRVRGRETGTNTLTATRLERRNDSATTKLRGTARDVVAPKFTILGVVVETNSSTVFRGEDEQTLTSEQFFANAAGRVVSAKGTLAGVSLIAREVEYEDED